jgi:hypothetical protein
MDELTRQVVHNRPFLQKGAPPGEAKKLLFLGVMAIAVEIPAVSAFRERTWYIHGTVSLFQRRGWPLSRR